MDGNFNARYSRTVVTPGLFWGRLSLDGELAIAIIAFDMESMRILRGAEKLTLKLSEPQSEFYSYDVHALPLPF
ncbi:MAG: hypothetical protein ACI8XU_001251 [Kiritimatiellia bacterium]|jgi:hypothetical protein